MLNRLFALAALLLAGECRGGGIVCRGDGGDHLVAFFEVAALDGAKISITDSEFDAYLLGLAVGQDINCLHAHGASLAGAAAFGLGGYRSHGQALRADSRCRDFAAAPTRHPFES